MRLVRNRHFKVWSEAAQPEGIPDEIVLDVGGTPDAQLTAVQRGRADVALERSRATGSRSRAPGTQPSSMSHPVSLDRSTSR